MKKSNVIQAGDEFFHVGCCEGVPCIKRVTIIAPMNEGRYLVEYYDGDEPYIQPMQGDRIAAQFEHESYDAARNELAKWESEGGLESEGSAA